MLTLKAGGIYKHAFLTELKDEVGTPGGATIEAVAELERKGFRAAVMSAMEQCFEKTKALSRKNN
ncbi:pyrroline-5-carboxylate reductase [Cytobacillus firmus]|uniref:pyrroline-5-carboxylate reductase dimerization domain-containing protein n=1 Tax=Cytobacillus firmus TaxID=1399 RepID=UPI000E124E73|nr:pyrroline-5-carboxylate reductase [Cytobacillus firmus]